MLNKTDTTGPAANATFRKSTAAKITAAQTETATYPAKDGSLGLLFPAPGDSFNCVQTIEYYNNYTSAGTHSNTAHYLDKTDSTPANQTKDDDITLPWWLVMMLRKANPNSEWIKQMLEEAGLENIDTEKLSAAEELLEHFGEDN